MKRILYIIQTDGTVPGWTDGTVPGTEYKQTGQYLDELSPIEINEHTEIE